MRSLAKAALSFWLFLALAGGAGAAEFGLRSDGWYAPPKAVAAVLDYSVDWNLWLAGDQISASSWAYSTGITHGAESLNEAKTITTTWLSSGTAGQKYSLTNTITTTGGRTNQMSFKVEVK
jgi:hypothetical protein